MNFFSLQIEILTNSKHQSLLFFKASMNQEHACNFRHQPKNEQNFPRTIPMALNQCMNATWHFLDQK